MPTHDSSVKSSPGSRSADPTQVAYNSQRPALDQAQMPGNAGSGADFRESHFNAHSNLVPDWAVNPAVKNFVGYMEHLRSTGTPEDMEKFCAVMKVNYEGPKDMEHAVYKYEKICENLQKVGVKASFSSETRLKIEAYEKTIEAQKKLLKRLGEIDPGSDRAARRELDRDIRSAQTLLRNATVASARLERNLALYQGGVRSGNSPEASITQGAMFDRIRTGDSLIDDSLLPNPSNDLGARITRQMGTESTFVSQYGSPAQRDTHFEALRREMAEKQAADKAARDAKAEEAFFQSALKKFYSKSPRLQQEFERMPEDVKKRVHEHHFKTNHSDRPPQSIYIDHTGADRQYAMDQLRRGVQSGEQTTLQHRAPPENKTPAPMMDPVAYRAARRLEQVLRDPARDPRDEQALKDWFKAKQETGKHPDRELHKRAWDLIEGRNPNTAPSAVPPRTEPQPQTQPQQPATQSFPGEIRTASGFYNAYRQLMSSNADSAQMSDGILRLQKQIGSLSDTERTKALEDVAKAFNNVTAGEERWHQIQWVKAQLEDPKNIARYIYDEMKEIQSPVARDARARDERLAKFIEAMPLEKKIAIQGIIEDAIPKSGSRGIQEDGKKVLAQMQEKFQYSVAVHKSRDSQRPTSPDYSTAA